MEVVQPDNELAHGLLYVLLKLVVIPLFSVEHAFVRVVKVSQLLDLVTVFVIES